MKTRECAAKVSGVKSLAQFALMLGFVLSAAACSEGDAIAFYQAPKENVRPHWDKPAHWTEGPAKPMRVATFAAGDAEVVISKFAADRFGGMLENINRWRTQVGLEPIDDAAKEESESIKVGDIEGKVFDFTGPEKDGVQKRTRVAMISRGADVWFFRLNGAAAAVEAQREEFDTFVMSIRFEQP